MFLYIKVLFYFCKINNEFDFVWIIEDDVLVPTINTIPNIDEKYSHFDSDLLSSSNVRNLDFNNNEDTIQALIEEITQLRQENLTLQQQILNTQTTGNIQF